MEPSAETELSLCSRWTSHLSGWLGSLLQLNAAQIVPLADVLMLCHFNDVYNVETAKKTGGAARFVAAMARVRQASKTRHVDPVVVFSGDCFNPSIMSTVVKGQQMPLVLDAAGVQCAVVGNHDFDHGPERLAELIAMCSFPWLLSNVQLAREDHDHPDAYSSYQPLVRGLKEHMVLNVGGRRLGLIGLVEEDWLETLFHLPRSSIAYEDYRATAARLTTVLRAPPYSCHAVVALTHMRQPNDDALASSCVRAPCARAVASAISLSPLSLLACVLTHSFTYLLTQADLDAILAGHDHHYGVTQVGGTHIFKSGTDFENFTTVELSFAPSTPAATSLDGGGDVATTRGSTRPSWSAVRTRVASFAKHDVSAEEYGDGDAALAGVLAPFEKQVDSLLGATLCESVQSLDCTRDCLRLCEAPLGSLVADVMRAATGADVALINGGTLRAERVLPPGPLSMRELFEVLPMMENVIVISVSGALIARALENAVSKYPKKDGRFAQVSGLSFVFDPSKPSGSRVSRVRVGDAPLVPHQEYKLTTKEFIGVEGKDGYDAFVGCPILVDAEAHPAIPTLVQRHLEALRQRGQPLRLATTEGRITLAQDSACLPLRSQTPTAGEVHQRMRRISKDVAGHSDTAPLRRISKELFTEPTIALVDGPGARLAARYCDTTARGACCLPCLPCLPCPMPRHWPRPRPLMPA